MAIKIYLAAAFSRQSELQAYAERLDIQGFKVTASWLQPHETDSHTTDDSRTNMAERDLSDIDDAEIFITFTEPKAERIKNGYLSTTNPRGGRHVEFGYALALDKEVWVVGPKENVFHHAKGVRQFDTFDDVMEELM